jgi:hypothetical protein
LLPGAYQLDERAANKKAGLLTRRCHHHVYQIVSKPEEWNGSPTDFRPEQDRPKIPFLQYPLLNYFCPMPKSTNSIQVFVRVRPDLEDWCRHHFHQLYLAKIEDPLFLYIRDNPNATIEEVRKHFGYKKKPPTIINMCKRTGLPLKDLPAK